MPRDVEIYGLASLDQLSRALRSAGVEGKGLRREIVSSLNAETKETRKEMRAAILPALPQSGGLAADVQRSTRITTSVATGGNPGVRIKARGKRSIRRMNRTGTFRRPVFGRREVWVSQFQPGLANFLERPFVQSRPELQQAVLAAITRARAKIYRSI